MLVGLDLPQDSTTLLLQALLLPVEESQTGLLVSALEANLFQTKTGGGAIALDTSTGHLIFCHQLALREDSTESQ